MTVSFYLDVHVQRENFTSANVTNVLRQAAANNRFKPLTVESISLTYVVVGELSLISEERERERENITGTVFLLRLRFGCLKHD